jgi:hypothetical protein
LTEQFNDCIYYLKSSFCRFYCKTDVAMNKDVRNAFVELSLGELGRDIPRLLDYCAADVRATHQATLCSRRWNS